MASRIYGDQINSCFERKNICEHDCHSGNWKGFDFDVFVVKEPNDNMIMVSIYSRIIVSGDQKEEYWLSKGKVLTFEDI